jgi:DNA-binding MarR family transcriptional regulator
VRYNCCVGSSASDAELQQLLRLLLRGLSPGAAPGQISALETAGGRPVSTQTGAVTAVSPSEARALTELLAARGIAQGQLAALLGLEKSTVSRLAAGLERKGWIRRGRDEENQRYMRLYLTPEGQALASKVGRAWWSRQARILAGLSAEERAGLAIGLRGLARSLAAEGLLTPAPPAAAGSHGSPQVSAED